MGRGISSFFQSIQLHSPCFKQAIYPRAQTQQHFRLDEKLDFLSQRTNDPASAL